TDGAFVGDVDLDFDANRILFSQPDADRHWRIAEMSLHTDGTTSGPGELPLTNEDAVDCYDGCYLPDGRVIFCSTACCTGVPCVNGSGHVCNLYQWDPKRTDRPVRQLTLEQDHDWCPTVKPDGRVMYLRWEYTDLPHAFSRILFHMNPDGTNQSEYYGSGSYWPGTIFYARAIPELPPSLRPDGWRPECSPKFFGITSGHHEVPRMGDLVLFDPSKGRRETQGAVQKIPGYGKDVEPLQLDLPIADSWPKFLHPFPLSEEFCLVSMKPDAGSPWGIWLVDRFDNLLCLYEEPGFAMFEPIPLRRTERPPELVDRVDLTDPEAEVFIADIYAGDGLRGVPRGVVKSLRVISYQFAYQGMGAEPYSVGLDGPWDPKVVLGTVPVRDDGSVSFRIPAMVPVSFQPLDEDGKAIQLMRSWMTAMPGESVSCVGCHETQNSTPPETLRPLAATEPAVALTPFPGDMERMYVEVETGNPPVYRYGDPENRGGFSFRREVQPVLDHYCIVCHGNGEGDGDRVAEPCLVDGETRPALDNQYDYNRASVFSPSYCALRRHVRTLTKESVMSVHLPWEFHADSTRLVQLLESGHHGVKLDPESWTRILTWIDLNAPYHGNWWDLRGDGAPDAIPDVVRNQASLRRELRLKYTGLDRTVDDPVGRTLPELVYSGEPMIVTEPDDSSEPIVDSRARSTDGRNLATDTVDTSVVTHRIPIDETTSIEMVQIPGTDFLIGRFEITNEQYAMFAPDHDSGIEYGDYIQFSPGEMGWPLNRASQPVARVSWNDANRYCGWLSERSGRRFTLPTADQWRMAVGEEIETEKLPAAANLADRRYAQIDPFGWSDRTVVIPAWRPAVMENDDRSRVSAPVGSYTPNRYGIHDMIGNVAEWTTEKVVCLSRGEGGTESTDRTDRENREGSVVKRVVRGGSWADTPNRATVDGGRAYREYQPVFDVGFRVVCELTAD
ncbi:MAG: SUMF1/EgtB/PvdO family nonheme iron enzyme, partial [Planctomycetia bacterium]|nr:SUMF1/EgtB/PvdO family nonheme iron enzyme [Planctomycetia bacterium]